ncbi:MULTISPECIES: DUF456 domain-containing protein [Streptomyces]|uniref:DUF456 domain-containing protein n=2 Tax=Streptomyces nigrescens TaxID=1920 RepID=A0A640TDR7_STRNI|nr:MULTISPECIES: DUF456 domain-containing protein [Streptomyces]AWN30372.1 DUF456 domain-containing protein [Streptomyces sp. NEAU-S7GS2]MCX5447334.1 DUF456 domain-containing protein [Streptomyces libani]WAT95988.1 DUF456 domain-containing protein [Streptomyces libani subsp. libani]WAU03608.1 DUF456 domain-containing protein [Streptomyces nigrescens]GFE21304.1 membrane protein [Streptomyces libani subsp. libani]
MSVWQLVAAGLVMLLGLLGVLVPGIPGPLIVWAGVMWWTLSEKSALAWVVLMAATALLLLNQVLKWLLPARNLRAVGTPYRALFLAGVAGIVGFFVIPVIGGVLGSVGGLYLLERIRLGSHGDAWASTRTALRAIGLSVLVELFACLLVVGAWIGAVVAG